MTKDKPFSTWLELSPRIRRVAMGNVYHCEAQLNNFWRMTMLMSIIKVIIIMIIVFDNEVILKSHNTLVQPC